jgi:mRNA-degrading endonuclease RelE of RelBE toxin-antitoxin system
MDLVFSDSAKKELENLPQELKVLFLNRLEKMVMVPPRKRMKHPDPRRTSWLSGRRI